MDIFSDSSSSIITTYSQQLRIERDIRKTKRCKRIASKLLEGVRQRRFKFFYRKRINESNSIFNKIGMNFVRFDHKKIKFIFQPNFVVKYTTNTVFYMCLRNYKNKFWMISRDHVPVNCKSKVYQIFFGLKRTLPTDDNIMIKLREIYFVLSKWCQKDQKFREDLIKSYRSGKDVFLTKELEEQFLTEEEIFERRSKRQKILDRMIPPARQKN